MARAKGFDKGMQRIMFVVVRIASESVLRRFERVKHILRNQEPRICE